MAPGLDLASGGLSMVWTAAWAAQDPGRDIVEVSCREEVYLSTSAVNLEDHAHLGAAVIKHAAHNVLVAAVGDLVVVELVVDIHCSGSSSPGLLGVTRPRTGQPWW